jgi:hypothetical protein
MQNSEKLKIKTGDLISRNIHKELWLILEKDVNADGDIQLTLWLNTTGGVHCVRNYLILADQLTLLSGAKR